MSLDLVTLALAKKYTDEKAGGGDSGYTLPVGGENLGGVKNGGNVVINEDGTMTAPEAGSIKITGTENSKIAPTGTILDNGTEIHLVSQEIRVNPGEQYLLTCSANFGNSLYAIYESNGAKKENLEAPATEEGRSAVDLPVTIPSDGAILRVAWNKDVTDTPYAVTKVGNAVVIPKSLDGVTVAVIGDSLVERNNSAKVNFVDLIAAETGATVTNLGVGGTGYMAGADESKAFYQRAAQIPEGTDRVLIYGSGNDRNMPLGNPTDTGTDTLCGCINATIDAVYERVPTAWVGIIAPAPWKEYPPYGEKKQLELMVQAQQRICARRGIPFLDLYHASGLRPWDDTFRELAFDEYGVHPNDTGHALIAPQIQAFLLGAIGGGAVASVPDSSQNVELDTTLTQSGAAADAAATGARIKAAENAITAMGGTVSVMEPAEYDIPKIFFGGALQQTKDEAVVPFRYISKTQDISGYAEIKAQGNSSMSYAKKNQTVKLFKDAECTEKLKVDFKGWGKQNKHCYKANWIDLSHARNVVSARLWGDIVKSRANYAELPELLRTSPNQGAVDGFPVKVYAAGVYQGRYTINIPKDKWMANMDDELDTHCILCGENYVSGLFRAAANINGSDWTDEVHDTVPASIKTRWNEVISFVMNSTDAEFKADLGQYFDIPSLIDYHLFGLQSCGLDAYGKNQLYMTYDGQQWLASMYDMDSTWGLYWNGASFVATDYSREQYEDMKNTNGDGNLLYVRLEQLFWAELQARWPELKAGALSIENIINRFERFTDIAPAELVKEDFASTTGGGKFTGIPSQSTNNIQQIRSFALARQAWVDEYVAGLTPEEEVPCTGITLSASELTFTEAGTQTLTATVEPENTTDSVVWSSDVPSVATVTGGVVRARGNGNALITATCGDQSASCSVSVSGIESGGTDGTVDAPVLYSLPETKTFNGTSDYIDTGVKLFDEKKDFTIFTRYKALTANSNVILLHCMDEGNAGYPGLTVKGSGAMDANPGGPIGLALGTASVVVEFAIVYSNGVLTRTSSRIGFAEAIDAEQTSTYAALDNNLFIGAQQNADGTMSKYWAGTIYRFDVYGAALTQEEIASLHISSIDLLQESEIEWETGKMINADGAVTTGTNYVSTLIPITGYNMLTTANVNGGTATYTSLTFYASDETFVSKTAEVAAGTATSYTVPEGAAFARMMFYPNGDNTPDKVALYAAVI